MLPNNLDLFSWSLPFLVDKIAEMMDHLLKKNSLVDKNSLKIAKQSSDVEFGVIMKNLEEEKEAQEQKAEEKNKKLTRIKAKVMTIARFNRMNKKI